MILPDTTSGVHAGAPFLACYNEFWNPAGGNALACPWYGRYQSMSALAGQVDVGWMSCWGAGSPASHDIEGLGIGAALEIDRAPAYSWVNPSPPTTLAGWLGMQPSWIEYQADRKTPAWEYDTPASQTAPCYMPLNIADAAVREFIVDTYVKPSIDNGYPLVFFDNFQTTTNVGQRIGHFDAQGVWTPQYTGVKNDPAFQADMLSWLAWLVEQVHALGGLVAVNYSGMWEGAAAYEQVYALPDLVWDEGGFTNWGNGPLLGKYWLMQYETLSYAAQKTGLMIGGTTSKDPNVFNVTPLERMWITANYLLVKGSKTYQSMNPSGYGFFYDFPEYSLAIGEPTGPAVEGSDGIWTRPFTGGTAEVNPAVGTGGVTLT